MTSSPEMYTSTKDRSVSASRFNPYRRSFLDPRVAITSAAITATRYKDDGRSYQSNSSGIHPSSYKRIYRSVQCQRSQQNPKSSSPHRRGPLLLSAESFSSSFPHLSKSKLNNASPVQTPQNTPSSTVPAPHKKSPKQKCTKSLSPTAPQSTSAFTNHKTH